MTLNGLNATATAVNTTDNVTLNGLNTTATAVNTTDNVTLNGLNTTATAVNTTENIGIFEKAGQYANSAMTYVANYISADIPADIEIFEKTKRNAAKEDITLE